MKQTCLIAILACAFSSRAVAQQVGEWEEFSFPFGNTLPDAIVVVHLIHVFDGTNAGVVAITYAPPFETACTTYLVGRSYLWTPPTGIPGSPGLFQNLPNCNNFIFCCGHSSLADGRILTAGGDRSTPSSFAG